MYNKEGKIKLETSAHYVPIGKTNIVFYDMDINTADLVFMITRNQRPLEVSDENVDCILMLKAKDDSYIVDTAHVEDPKNGKVRYTIPKEFLSHDGDVQGQVWIAIQGKEDIITEVEFSFEIKDSLFDHIPAVDKVNYIKTFDDLRKRIEDRVEFIEKAVENGDDYVAEMETALQTGKKYINDTVTKSNKTVEDIAGGAIKTVNSTKENAVSAMNNQSTKLIDEAKSLVNSTRNTAISDMNEQSKKYINEAIKAKDDVTQAIDQWDFSSTNLLTRTSDEWQETTWSSWGTGRIDILLQNTGLLAGDKITFSMDIDNTIDIENEANVTAKIIFYDTDNNDLENKAGNNIDPGENSVSVVTAEIPEGTYRISVFQFYKSDGSSTKTARTRKLVLNRGMYPADWSLNPAEVASKSELDGKLNKGFLNDFIEHGFLELESGFENYEPEIDASKMQYFRVGNMCKIYGNITNKGKIDKDSEIVVSKLPEHLKVIANDVAVSQGSVRDQFVSRIFSYKESHANEILIFRFADESGSAKDFVQNRWLNVSLTCMVEVDNDV
ncbi:MAG: phage baseplate upper protein [Staphylococcus equorum]|uniref:phage baseplate upper protein n=1 Tax=Tetragenococcus koreensis TaxID=290335 RepID=UPI001F3BCA0A|nr:phage baseplate upper protein [Tetragenococcus koreensis]MDN6571257.1 phage baseplate upper protein [Staphylococcus equorum]MCF1615994.1 phage baseplate upper protein [Tetragenococcus koreensis]MCF1625775.1 phage baseplate upper protein [Tetragenococcus koreensis]MDN6147076.1 phage baseplate upper protein [Tetragenococcus koreensis]MDN6166953.1 phage baseplate upper protein [Tetragenococcus koreensis]